MGQISVKNILVDHTVQDKEYLIKICKKYGIKNWRQVYDAPYNKDFRKKSPDPDKIYPKSVFVVPNKKIVVTELRKTVKEKQDHVKKLKQAIKDVEKGKKETRDKIVKYMKKHAQDYQTAKILEMVAMMFVPMAGMVTAAVKGGQMAISMGRWGIGYLTLLSINTTKLVAKSNQFEDTAFQNVMRKASDWTSPSYWLVSALSDEGMDHSDFTKKTNEQIKKFGDQADVMKASLQESVDTTEASIRAIEQSVKELEKL